MSGTENTSSGQITAIHLDAVGGVAGDMFAAAMIDALPWAWPACERAIAAMAPPENVSAGATPFTDGVLTGLRFDVDGLAHNKDPNDPHGHHQNHAHDHQHHHSTGHQGGHHPWRDIRRRIEAADLTPSERDIALAIFTRLAIAEAAVHGITPDDVTFHEVGAWDSIIDIITAAAIIAQLPDGCVWSVGALPRGRGLVKSAHGMLPLPAPATVELLKGYDLIDDGEDGERITPTGAAIVAHLTPTQSADGIPRKLTSNGTGFGTKRLAKRSNILRATVYGASSGASQIQSDVVEVLRFEIDDQTPEDLAIALERIRQTASVVDVCQWPVMGKKGRLATAVQVLTREGTGSEVARLALDETTTLGVRRAVVARDIVERKLQTIGGVQVKVADRPSGPTAKTEALDVADIETHAARQHARWRTERSVLDPDHNDE